MMCKEMQDFKPFLHRRKQPPTILVSAAIPEEYRPLKTIFDTSRTILGNIPVYETYLTSHPKSSEENVCRHCVLVATGMGPNFWFRHGLRILNHLRPDLLISFGFCGELTASHSDSGLYIPTIFRPPGYHSSSPLPVLSLTLPSSVIKTLAAYGGTVCQAISVPVYVPKKFIATKDTAPSILDMESYFTALVASLFGLPFICLRAKTDGPDDEIPFEVNRLIDSSGFVSIRRVLSYAFGDPGVIVSFFRYFRRSAKAAAVLKEAVLAVLRLPLADLTSIEPPRIMGDSDQLAKD
ncbi:hypothetical protein [Thermodesulforhabdus norvegica]|uniref:hypothetical protein n=1 Tax=Thermodesulforhabdus norvegica TaxID=39841 RepID=UPI0015A50F6B|nr:hypothetical protein [Thermodesulforhabdus norvegica]